MTEEGGGRFLLISLPAVSVFILTVFCGSAKAIRVY